ncbi:MAG TPA: Lrp/AsnC family transcriptional regulator [Thermofilum sp.]|nr:Lrp/AsnC family transcriptional regulator [Thermofilum sp.]
MDSKDLRILELLSENARISKLRIAEELGVTEAAVRKRIKRLEEEGVILGYRTIINYRKLGMAYSITGVEVEPDAILDVIRALRSMGSVRSIFLTSGDHDLVVEVVAKNMGELEKVHEEMKNIKGVRKVYPAIVNEVVV